MATADINKHLYLFSYLVQISDIKNMISMISYSSKMQSKLMYCRFYYETGTLKEESKMFILLKSRRGLNKKIREPLVYVSNIHKKKTNMTALQ